MKNDQQEAYERVLTTSLGRVIDFLRFAEAKNAALLTFASAWILGSVNLLTGKIELSSDWRVAFSTALPFFGVAAFIAILSFLPKTLLSQFHRDPDQSKSLLYFGDAALFAPAAYRQRLEERYRPPDDHSATQNYLDDVAIQIAVNSQITVRKLRFFNAGAIVVLIALFIVTLPAAIAVWQMVAPLTRTQ